MEVFGYAFIQRAFIMGILLAAIIPCTGPMIVHKRLSAVGNTLSHISLARVAAGPLLGLNPILIAAAACMVAAIGIEAMRRKIPRSSEVSTAIIMPAGISLAGVLPGFIRDAANFSSFLFGNIVVVSNGELYLIIAVSTMVLLTSLLICKELFYMPLDEQGARPAGAPVRTVNFLFTVLVAVTVSVTAGTVGTLIVSPMMVAPVACAMQFGISHRQTPILTVVLDILFIVTGLSVAYYLGSRSDGTIVLVGIPVLILVSVGKGILG